MQATTNPPAQTTYEKVQFIAYCINTAPKDALGKKVYAGLNSDITDFTERIKLIKKAIETAREHEKTKQSDPKTLKIFMLPEFFFRGKTGAYSMDAILGQGSQKNLVNELQSLIRHSDWEHWLFIFGSIVGKSFQTQEAGTGQKLPGGATIDSTKKSEVYNYVLIQKGGINAGPETAHMVLKQFKSPEDFIAEENLLFNRLKAVKSKPAGKVLSGDKVEHLDSLKSKAPSSTKEPDPSFSGTSLFKQGNFQFGLEICLDHENRRLGQYLPKLKSPPSIDIQLLPSCGMYIKRASIVARKGGFIFNCDGSGEPFSQVMKIKSQDEITLTIKSKTLEDVLGKKDEIANKVFSEQASDLVKTLLELDKSGFAFLDKTKLIPLRGIKYKNYWAEDVPALETVDLDLSGVFTPGINIDQLFAQGAGQLRIYPEQTIAMPTTLSMENSLFPHVEAGMTFALADTPVMLNGMKVIFDQPVGVYPVNLESKDEERLNGTRSQARPSRSRRD